MRVALIGACGQLGTDLAPALAAEVVALDLPDFDVSQEDIVRKVLGDLRPHVVVNCAAITHVDNCETRPEVALAVNATGALFVAREAQRIGAAVLYISTDYVFGAEAARTQPYIEQDRPAPISVYGVSKLAGEWFTQAYNERWCIVRTSGLYGHAGALGKGGNFVETMLRLARENKPIRVVDDQRLCPTSTRALATRIDGLIQAAAQGLFHVTAPDSCTWFEFARAIFELGGGDVSVEPIPSSGYPLPAKRPAMSALATTRLPTVGVPPCPPWRTMLANYLADRSTT